MKPETLEKKTRAELFSLAKKHGVKTASTMTKKDLVKKISKGTEKTSKAGKTVKKAAKKKTVKKKTAAKKRTATSSDGKTKSISKTSRKQSSPKSKKQRGIEKISADIDDLSCDKQKIEEAKFYAGTVTMTENFSEEDFQFPQNYGQNDLVLMVRDPWWIYSYWEVTDGRREEVLHEITRRKLTYERSILRVYDVTGIDFNGKNANHFFDITLHGGASNWYINVGHPDRTWCAEIGMMTKEGRFFCLVRSNMVTTPRFSPSDIVDEEWLSLDEDYWRLFGVAGGFGIGKTSLEMKELFEKRYQEELSSGVVTSLSSPFGGKEAQRNFWLVADCELIVYGATEPDAKLTVQGQPVQLRSDGTFTLRYAFPDGKLDIPIRAASADEVDSRGISFTVKRKTDIL